MTSLHLLPDFERVEESTGTGVLTSDGGNLPLVAMTVDADITAAARRWCEGRPVGDPPWPARRRPLPACSPPPWPGCGRRRRPPGETILEVSPLFPGPLPGEKAQPDPAGGVVSVQVDKHDRLPRPELRAACDDGDDH
jgi:hypothetical protein